MKIIIKIVYNKKVYDISTETQFKVTELKQEIQCLTSVAPHLQKLIFKGKAINESNETLSKLGIKNNDKLLLVGSTVADIFAVNSSSAKSDSQIDLQSWTQTPFDKQKKHKKIIDKGVPEEAMPAYKNGNEPLPEDGIKGVINQFGKVCRFTFKLETDQFWVCSDEKTSKYDISAIASIVEEPIKGHEEYCILEFNLKTIAGKLILWFCWIPKQYVKAIKNAVH